MASLSRRNAMISNQKEDKIMYEEIVFRMFDNGYISNTEGRVIEYGNWKYSDFVPIKHSDWMLFLPISGGDVGYNAFYDVNKNFIKPFSVARLDTEEAVVPEVPANACYIRVSCRKLQNIRAFRLFSQ